MDAPTGAAAIAARSPLRTGYLPVIAMSIVALVAACGGAAATPAPSEGAGGALLPDKGSVTILTWEGYTSPEWLAAYQEETGVEVTAIEVGSVDEMFAKAQASAGQIDIAHFDIGNLQRYKDAGLLEPFDLTKVPNASNIAANLPWQDAFTIDGELYGLAYNWGTLPLMWRIDAFDTAPDSWTVLWDPEYAGKVTVPDDSYLGIPMVALAMGIENPYELDEAAFATVKQGLDDLRPQLKTLTGGFNDAVQLYAAGDVIVGYCQNVAVVNDLNKDGVKFAYGYPKEGTPFWIDGAEILSGGNRQEVYDFINHTMAVDWQADLIEATGNAGIIDYETAKATVPAEVLDKTEVRNLADEGFADRMRPMVAPNNMDERLSLWNEFKAGF